MRRLHGLLGWLCLIFFASPFALVLRSKRWDPDIRCPGVSTEHFGFRLSTALRPTRNEQTRSLFARLLLLSLDMSEGAPGKHARTARGSDVGQQRVSVNAAVPCNTRRVTSITGDGRTRTTLQFAHRPIPVVVSEFNSTSKPKWRWGVEFAGARRRRLFWIGSRSRIN